MKPSVIVAPSILSADFSRLERDIRMVERAGARWLHIDVMDGDFVPNLTVGPVVVASLRSRTKLFFDVHLMIQRPDLYWKAFRNAGADLITVHCESPVRWRAVVRQMRLAGLKVGVSIKPATPLSRILPALPELDLVLIMTVEPGFGGQSFMEPMLKKVAALRAEIDRRKLACRIEVDGGINLATGRQAVAAGADVLVAGHAVFRAASPASAVRALARIRR